MLTKEIFKNGILSNNQLKIIAIITMTIDHIGAYLLPQYAILRIIGRLAFPIFAYMIAEGCTYTKNRRRYLGLMAAAGILFQLVYFAVTGSLHQYIFITFSLSIVLIYALDYAIKQSSAPACSYALLILALIYFICEYLPRIIPGFGIDYGFLGVIVPAVVFAARKRIFKLLLLALSLCLLAGESGGVQWYSLLAVPLVALYNNQRGRLRMKHFFYAYYPLHLAAIFLLEKIIH